MAQDRSDLKEILKHRLHYLETQAKLAVFAAEHDELDVVHDRLSEVQMQLFAALQALWQWRFNQ
jgi:hypothetical protein